MSYSCECIVLTYTPQDEAELTFELTPAGIYNGQVYYTFNDGSQDLYIYWYGVGLECLWGISTVLGSLTVLARLEICGCPFGNWELLSPKVEQMIVSECACDFLQDRTFKKYDAIRLPEIFEEQDRGFFRCCCPFIVLADGSSTTWKNDITSAWIKLSGPSDTATATLYKNGVPTTYQPTEQSFVNEPNAFYWTVPWAQVLGSDGVGCYELKISYDISGIVQTFTWGNYTLKPYTIQNALKTARIRVILDSQQEIEGINFSGSQVEDSIRFYGYIGNRQPNTEIDNLIYQNREVKKVVRENLNTYEIITDPTCDEHIKKLTDLYLLSENQLFISDYNAHNHSYRYLDLPAIVQESPEITYFEFSREASLKCIVGDKFKNQRSYYK